MPMHLLVPPLFYMLVVRGSSVSCVTIGYKYTEKFFEMVT